MADEEDLAAEGAAEGGEVAPVKSKKKLIIMVAAALLLLGGGGAGGYFFFFKGKDKHAEAPPPIAKPPVFMEVPEVLVNLSQAPGERTQYVKARVVLEVKEQLIVVQILPLMPRVTDTFQTYLRELRPADLAGSAGLYRLREELTRRVNSAIAPHQVNAVLFREVVVQ
jgi:flagellar protein FliL